MPKPVLEQATLTESVNKKTGKILVDIVTPGLGTSGYYSTEVCEAAAGLVTAGTQMFLDHPTDAEAAERPIRSVKDIAAVFTESARWDPDRGENGSLVAEAQVVPAWVETMDVIQGAIGVSLRGSATDIVEGEVPGVGRVPVIEGLHSIDSVDFVTRAGRGGAFALLESASPSRVHARAVGHGVEEATVNDDREALQTLLRDTYGAEKTYVWVRDFDDGTVWFEVESGEDSGIFGQPYTRGANDALALDGDRTEVRVQTTYVPVARPGSTNPTEESEEDTMPKIQIEESEHTALVEKAGRVETLESENTTLKTKVETLQEATARRDRADRAREIVAERAKEAGVEFTALEAKGLLADLPVKDGALDEDAFATAVDEAAKGKTAAAGEGTVRGFGGTTTAGEVTESEAPTRTPWGRELKGA